MGWLMKSVGHCGTPVSATFHARIGEGVFYSRPKLFGSTKTCLPAGNVIAVGDKMASIWSLLAQACHGIVMHTFFSEVPHSRAH